MQNNFGHRFSRRNFHRDEVLAVAAAPGARMPSRKASSQAQLAPFKGSVSRRPVPAETVVADDRRISRFEKGLFSQLLPASKSTRSSVPGTEVQFSVGKARVVRLDSIPHPGGHQRSAMVGPIVVTDRILKSRMTVTPVSVDLLGGSAFRAEMIGPEIVPDARIKSRLAAVQVPIDLLAGGFDWRPVPAEVLPDPSALPPRVVSTPVDTGILEGGRAWRPNSPLVSEPIPVNFGTRTVDSPIAFDLLKGGWRWSPLPHADVAAGYLQLRRFVLAESTFPQGVAYWHPFSKTETVILPHSGGNAILLLGADRGRQFVLGTERGPFVLLGTIKNRLTEG